MTAFPMSVWWRVSQKKGEDWILCEIHPSTFLIQSKFLQKPMMTVRLLLFPWNAIRAGGPIDRKMERRTVRLLHLCHLSCQTGQFPNGAFSNYTRDSLRKIENSLSKENLVLFWNAPMSEHAVWNSIRSLFSKKSCGLKLILEHKTTSIFTVLEEEIATFI